MKILLKVEDCQLWFITLKGSLIPTKTKFDGKKAPTTKVEFDAEDFRMIDKNPKAIKNLYFGLGIDEYNKISGCAREKKISTPLIWHMKVRLT